MTKLICNLITFCLLAAFGAGCATTAHKASGIKPPPTQQPEKKRHIIKEGEALAIHADETQVTTWTESERRTQMALMTGNQDDVLVRPEDGFECTTRWVCNEDRGTCYCRAASSPSDEFAAYPAVE